MHLTSLSLRGRTIDSLLVYRVWVARIEARGPRLGLRGPSQPAQGGNGDHFSFLGEQPVRELLGMLLREAQRLCRACAEGRAGLFEQGGFRLGRVRSTRWLRRGTDQGLLRRGRRGPTGTAID